VKRFWASRSSIFPAFCSGWHFRLAGFCSRKLQFVNPPNMIEDNINLLVALALFLSGASHMLDCLVDPAFIFKC
jgi:hypothetical protein